MIQKIKLENFKCFKKLEINTNMLNIFSGLNGMGKSTTIQSLLLLRQSYEQGFFPRAICLNGNYINIGTGRDLMLENADQEHILIELTDNKIIYNLKMSYKNDLDILDVVEPFDDTKIKNSLSLLCNSFEYLNAERISPQVIYPKSSFHINSLMQLGINGQYAAHYLFINQDNPIVWDSCNGKEKYLKGAVQYWLNYISPNVKIDIQDIENTDFAKIGYYYTDNEKSNTFRPTNIGFGVSYILPVVIALLKAKIGSILIIENPEAHLHPKGQRKIGELIAKCASSGVQIFIETHSDHILNGIRISVKNKIIKHNDVNLFFFDKVRKNKVVEHIVETPKINEQGKLDYWPDGFFDEWEKALDEII